MFISPDIESITTSTGDHLRWW